MRRRLLLGVTALAAGLGLAACAPAMPGFPGAPSAVTTPEPSLSAPGAAPDGPSSAPPEEPASAVDGAVVIGDGAVEVELWVDLLCPYCRMFEEANGDYLGSLVDAGAATLRVHPIAILNRVSAGTQYSTRAANAFVCVAERAPDEALGYLRRLYAIQPEEGTGGLTDRELAGEAPSAAAECILDGWFSDWVDEWTQRALDLGIRGTPTVVVDGRLYPGGFDPADFRAFVESTPVRTVGEPRPVTA
ncbi:MAG: hypothetical protein BGO95_10205 [Micrococcales bacterium 73-13]|nr:MAG: hypothetical protein BGO95_10205 [Micrococcales bacterium 73-13]